MYRDYTAAELAAPRPQPKLAYALPGLKEPKVSPEVLKALGDRVGSWSSIRQHLNPQFADECKVLYDAFCYYVEQEGLTLPDDMAPSIVPGIPAFCDIPQEAFDAASKHVPRVVTRIRMLGGMDPRPTVKL